MKRALVFAPVLVLVLLVGGCNEDKSTTPSTPTAPTSTAVASAPAPASSPPAPTQPVSLVVKLNPSPPTGPVPLTLRVNMCGSRPQPPVDDYPLTFTLDYGDGGHRSQTFCRDHHTYNGAGSFGATFCATDGISGHESCANFRVRVD